MLDGVSENQVPPPSCHVVKPKPMSVVTDAVPGSGRALTVICPLLRILKTLPRVSVTVPELTVLYGSVGPFSHVASTARLYWTW